ncbi:MAG: hypothetical protein V3R45_05775 [Candidatus Aminicenantaceae bacterium]
MRERGKKFTALFLVFCIVALSGNLTAQQKKGAKLTVEKTDGQEVTGELITVKKDSLLLLNAETNADINVQIKDVKAITIRKKSMILELGLLGALGGAATQGLTGKTGREVKGETQFEDVVATKKMPSFLLYGAIAGGVGLLLGAVIGMNKKIQIQGKSDTEIQETMEKLSKKARVPNFQ